MIEFDAEPSEHLCASAEEGKATAHSLNRKNCRAWIWTRHIQMENSNFKTGYLQDVDCRDRFIEAVCAR